MGHRSDPRGDRFERTTMRASKRATKPHSGRSCTAHSRPPSERSRAENDREDPGGRANYTTQAVAQREGSGHSQRSYLPGNPQRRTTKAGVVVQGRMERGRQIGDNVVLSPGTRFLGCTWRDPFQAVTSYRWKLSHKPPCFQTPPSHRTLVPSEHSTLGLGEALASILDPTRARVKQQRHPRNARERLGKPLKICDRKTATS